MIRYIVAAVILFLLIFGGVSVYKKYQGRIHQNQQANTQPVVTANKWNGKPVSTALHEAAWKASYEEITNLLEMGGDPNARDEHGQTPLHHAAFFNRLDVVKLLISYGGNPDMEDNFGWRPLNMVVEKPENEDVLSYLEEITTKRAPRNILD